MSSNSIPPEVVGKIKARWEAGERVDDIARECGIHSATVRAYARREGWDRESKRQEVIEEASQLERQVTIANKVERSVEETEKFIQDTERLRAMTLGFQSRLLKNKNEKGELEMDRKEADLVFQYLKCCKISMETLSIGYMGKRKALGMDEVLKSDVTILPWED